MTKKKLKIYYCKIQTINVMLQMQKKKKETNRRIKQKKQKIIETHKYSKSFIFAF